MKSRKKSAENGKNEPNQTQNFSDDAQSQDKFKLNETEKISPGPDAQNDTRAVSSGLQNVT